MPIDAGGTTMNEKSQVSPSSTSAYRALRLPSLPAVAIEVLRLTQDEDVNLDEIGRVISRDQALAARVLRTANSSFYGLRRACTTIQQAIVYLGLNTVKTLVLGFSLTEALENPADNGAKFDYQRYWQRGLYAAASARNIAKTTRACDPDEALLAALLQDMGMIVLYWDHGASYVNTVAGLPHDDLVKLEQELFGANHATVGAMICESWQLPPTITNAVRHHHGNDEAGLTEPQIGDQFGDADR